MKAFPLAAILIAFLALNGPSPTWAGEKVPPKTDEDKIRAVQKFLGEVRVDSSDFQKAMPLEQFLDAVAKKFPPGSKITLRIEKEAFGKKNPALAKKTFQLPPFPKKMSLGGVVRLVCGQAGTPADYRLEPAAIVITTPERTIYTHTYDIRDILEKWDSLSLDLKKNSGGLSRLEGEDIPGKAGPVIGWLLGWVDPQRWRPGVEPRVSFQVVNGSKLVIRTYARSHEEIDSLLQSFRRFAGLAVVMNARLVEVDTQFYAQHIRPLLLEPRGSVRAIVPIDAPLEALLQKQKLLLKGDETKHPTDLEAAILSSHTVFTYTAQAGAAGKEPVYRAGHEGFSVLAHIAISPDRRRVRLKIKQKVAQLVEIKKTEVLDLASVKSVVVESPHVRETSLSATLDVDDGQSILMPVLYRPKEKDRMWIMLASPTIYIEEEERMIREGLLPPVPRPEPKKEEPAKEPAKTKEPASGPGAAEKQSPTDVKAWKAGYDAGRKALGQARYAEAERAFAAALREAEKLPAKDHRLADTLVGLAEAHFRQGRYGQADRLCLRAEWLLLNIFGPRHPAVARCVNLRAEVYRALGFLDEAEKLARRALAIREKLLGQNHPDTAESIETLAALSHAPYSLEEGCLQVREKALGKDHPSLITSLLLLGRSGPDAEKHIRRALAIVKKAHGENHPDMAECLTALATLYCLQEKYDAALQTQKQALAILKKTLGPDHSNNGIGLRNLARIALAQKRPAAVEKYLHQALRCQFSGLNDREMCHYFPSARRDIYGVWEPLLDSMVTGQAALNHQEAYLLEMLRRGGDDIRAFLDLHNDEVVERWPKHRFGERWDHPGNLEILTVLRRLQGKPDPLPIVVSAPPRLECMFPNLPEFEVALTNRDFEKKPVIFQEWGDYRSGRQERWRFEVRDAKGIVLPITEQWGDGGGFTGDSLLEHGHSWNTTLAMKSFIDLLPGEYTVRVQYHDRLTIANLESTAGLVLCQSKPFKLKVQPRIIEVNMKEKAEARHWLDKLDGKEKIKVLAGSYGKHAHDFIPPASPAGKLLTLGWKAVPALLDEAGKEKLEPGKRAWALALLFSITSRNDPRVSGVLGSYQDREIAWQLSGGRDGQADSAATGWRADGGSEGKIDLAEHRAFSAQWQRFREFLVIREK